MRKMIIALLIISVVAGCKKRNDSCGGVCACTIGLADSIQGGTIDSATFYQELLGTWYLRQADTILSDIGCPHHCYCDASYPVMFLSNKTFVMHFAGNITDTFPYSFPIVAPQQIATQTYFYSYGNNPVKGQIQYVNSNYMIIQIASDSPAEDFDACPIFFLTRH